MTKLLPTDNAKVLRQFSGKGISRFWKCEDNSKGICETENYEAKELVGTGRWEITLMLKSVKKFLRKKRKHHLKDNGSNELPLVFLLLL